MGILKKRLFAIMLTLTVFLAVFPVLRPVGCTEYIDVDDYCWIEGDHMDIGFSKYGEIIGYNEDTETGLGIQYPGYTGAGNTYSQREETSVDPFANEEIGDDWWMNGWFIDIKYTPLGGTNREIWAFAMFSDGAQHGGDWIVMPSVAADSSARPLWQEYPPYATPCSWEYPSPTPPDGGRKTNGYCETDPIEIIYNGPRKFIAICRTRISDVGGAADLVDLTFTFIFNKVEKNVVVLADIERLYKKSSLNVQFGNRGQWDLGISPDTDSYIHWYTSEPVQYWDVDGDGAINGTEVETSFEDFKDYFLTYKHPEKWWDEVPSDERPTTVCDEWTEEMIPFPETWLEAQEGSYGLEGHMDSTIKENSYAVAQVIAQAGDYVGALAVWPHPEFWSAANTFFTPARTRAPVGNNPSSLPLMLSPISLMLEWHKWTVEEDPNQGEEGDVDDRDDIWVKADDIRMPDGSTLEPRIPFTIYEHDFELSSTLPEYRVMSAYLLSNYHDADDADADDPGNEEPWSNGLNVIDWEIQEQLDRIFIPAPVASFTYSPESPRVGQIVTFNASASYDPDGTIVSYDWDFGDETNGTGMITIHAYATFGTYTVNLTVTDNDGLTDWASTEITVPAPQPPVASFTWSPAVLLVGEEATFISTSTDPDGTIVSWAWDFNNDAITDATTEIATWTYNATGIVTITLTVTDDDGLFNGTAKTVTVAYGTIYIRADGSVDPPTAPISTVDNITYTLTDNIVDAAPSDNAIAIIIERNNIVLNGAGCTIQGIQAYDSKGISLEGRSNVTIKNIKISAFYYGIHLYESSGFNSISGNNITDNEYGVRLYHSSNNTVSGNTITNNSGGVGLGVSSGFNSISGNNITNNGDGIYLYKGSNFNTVSGNNITNNDGAGIEFVYSFNNSISGNTITNNDEGIELDGSNNTVSGNNIMNNSWAGIGLEGSNNTVSANAITDNEYGIYLSGSVNNISGNNITDNEYGVRLYHSSNNTVSGNNIANNGAGVYLSAKPPSFGNMFYHNNFLNNTIQARVSFIIYPLRNTWDDGYPSGGNYWSDYTGVDYYSGPYQNETGSDGIGDTPYVVEWDNQDNYPLMEHWTPTAPVPTTIGELKTKIEELGSEGEIDNQGIVTSLLAKLNVAQRLVENGKIDQAKNILNAFINEVQAQSGKHIAPEVAELLIESAEHILSHLQN